MNSLLDWFSKPLLNFTRIKLIGVAAVALLFAGASAYTAGYFVGAADAAKAQAEALKEDVKKAEKKGDQKVAEVVKAQVKETQLRTERVVRDIARERALQSQISSLKDKNTQLQRLLNETPDPLPDCHVALGDVRLLNEASTPASGGPDGQGLSDPATVAALKERTPSTVTCRALISEEVAVRTRYVDLSARHDALVDWVEKELVEPMRAAPEKPKTEPVSP